VKDKKMLKIKTMDGLTLISESGILGLQRNDYYAHDESKGHYTIEVQYQMGMVHLKFKRKNEADQIVDFIGNSVNKTNDTSTGRHDYIKGFKEGVEYALKLNK
jgi:hypothetical protein